MSSASELVRQHVGPAALDIYEAMTSAFVQGHREWSRLPGHGDHPYLLSHLVRVYARSCWKDAVPLGWRLAGNPKMGGQILLIHDEAGLQLRLRKENQRIHPGGVPSAGRTRAQYASWTQERLDLVIPRAPVERVPGECIELLLLMDWARRVDHWSVTARVVHPVAAGAFGHRVPFDFSMDLTPGTDLWAKLQFSGDEEPEDFFAEMDVEDRDYLDGTDGGF